MTSSEISVFFLVVAASFVSVTAVGLFLALRRKTPFPPGPKGLPIIGNALEVPMEYQWLYFSKLKQQFGDLTTFSILGMRVVVVNTRKDVLELTVKRSDTYFERPHLYSFDMVGWGQGTALLNSYPWKDHRRYATRLFGTRQLMQRFYGVEMLEARNFVRNFLRDPDELEHHIRYLSGAVILKITYGYTTQEGRDPLLTRLAWFLPMGWKKTPEHYRKTADEVITVPYNLVKEHMKAGTAVPCYLSDILEDANISPEEEDALKYSSASVYAAGADTSVSQIHGFFLIMMLEPDVQRKAQAEIDAVIGQDRLPNFTDRDHLPYIDAVEGSNEIPHYFTERYVTLFMRHLGTIDVIMLTGGPRRAMKDDVLRGYFIPEHSLILLNAICPGQQMAEATIWLSSVLALALFDIKPIKDSPTEFSFSEGGSFTGGPISRPSPFTSKITPRSSRAEALIRLIDEEVV
ncbi:hypothetical protein EUX98_g1008 [Antrodiella citrinella]|uniref:Cytochrome P450 n=1 Tax=Antrodiella citrinella TaxID=2447956 RepID=A0A4V3XJJ2_9APHY|nr:hypothetical protein EUX98_g1008 [Antrodiella citrinella]